MQNALAFCKILIYHPAIREIAAGSNGKIYLVHERRPKKIRLKSGQWMATGLYIRFGVDVYVKGEGQLWWKSGDFEPDDPYENEIRAYTPDGDPRNQVYIDEPGDTERFGEISIKGDRNGEIVIHGGLTKKEYSDIGALRGSVPKWH